MRCYRHREAYIPTKRKRGLDLGSIYSSKTLNLSPSFVLQEMQTTLTYIKMNGQIGRLRQMIRILVNSMQ